ncbi:MAG: hypothetical protein A2X08_03210 [Bacteroidetes bacterium GWA2_32_17]|nr:MAG: hypothetical protein A2X08_03210 [Bacteroidetes bacterium GWA2_32_17]
MTISGFTFVRNATRFYFPIKESILSILPIVDEFIVALGMGYDDDKTEEEILSVNSPKIKIIRRVWDEKHYANSAIFRDETNVALSYCKGDWCFYLQADEVIHENDITIINDCCSKYLNNKNIEGILFKYYHFWGDYAHYLPFHGWYRNEIRIIKNHCGVVSYKDAQSFRKKDGKKLNVVSVDAHIFHYGWVRPPLSMKSKKKEHDSIHKGIVNDNNIEPDNGFDYGPIGRLPVFNGTHPNVMSNRIKEIFWKDKLNYTKTFSKNYIYNKHEKTKYRIISWLENNLFGGKQLVGYKNWKTIK